MFGKKEELKTVFDDVYLVAYLALKGHKVVPTINRSINRVSFEVYGDVESTLSSYYSNDQVGISEYLRMLKQYRSTFFSMKSRD